MMHFDSLKKHGSHFKVMSVHRGSALVECVVCMGLIVPLLAYTIQLGKLGDLKQRLLHASRYAVWERSVSSHEPDLHLIQARFLADSHLSIAQIASQDNPPDFQRYWQLSTSVGNSANGTRPDARLQLQTLRKQSQFDSLLTNGETRRTFDTIERLSETNTEQPDVQFPAVPAEIVSENLVIGINASGDFPLQQTSCSDVAESSVFACYHARSALLTGHWSSGSDSQSARRARAFVPAVKWTEQANTLAAIEDLPFYAELNSLEGVLGHVDATILPLSAESVDTQPLPDREWVHSRVGKR